jgi:hypothetical protein
VYEADPDAEVPGDWIARKAGLPTDSFVRGQWAKFGMDAARWANLRAIAEASPFGPDIEDERHGFYRRLVCTK